MRPTPSNRKGGAAVEAAVCLPLIVFILLASIEMCSGLFHNYNAHAATYELSKLALKRETTSDDVQSKAAILLPSLGFDDYSITIDVENRTVNTASVEPTSFTSFSVPKTGLTTAGLESVPRGTVLRLKLTVDRSSQQSFGLFQNYLNTTINTDCVFVKEF